MGFVIIGDHDRMCNCLRDYLVLVVFDREYYPRSRLVAAVRNQFSE